MIDIPILIQQIGVLLLLILPGLALKWMRLAPEGLAVGLSNLILYIAQPVLFVAGFVAVDPTPAIVIRMLAVLVATMVVHPLFFFVAKLCFRKAPKDKQKVLVFATTFSNAGFIGIPLMQALFESTVPEIAIYASVYVAAFNVYVWSIGAYIFTEDKQYISAKKMLLNPSTVATYIGVALFALSAIPEVREAFIVPVFRQSEVVTSFMTKTTALVAPLSMAVVGLRLAELDVREALRSKYLYAYLPVSLLVIPTVSWILIKLVGVVGLYSDPLTTSVLLISAATPAAAATSMYAEKYGGDARFAGLVVSTSSVLCALTMPLVSLLGLL